MDPEIIYPYENLAALHAPYATELGAAFQEILKKGNFILGAEVETLEALITEACHRKYAIAVSSGTAALTLILKALAESSDKKEIVVPAMTCVPVVSAVIEAGLIPVYADVSERRYTLNPKEAESKISSQTLAILAVHLYGHVCDMDALTALSKEKNIFLIEDCAQAWGASWKGMPVGSFGIAAAFSFYPTKIWGALGDAGAISCQDEMLARRIREMREYGAITRGPYLKTGTNARMDALQAAFLRVKWQYLPECFAKKQALFEAYALMDIADTVVLPLRLPEVVDTPHIYPILIPERDPIKKKLEQAGVQPLIHYPYVAPLDLPNPTGGRYPVAEKVAKEELSLPVGVYYTLNHTFNIF